MSAQDNTAEATTQTLRIKHIVRDAKFQVRKKLDRGTIERYTSIFASGLGMAPVSVADVSGVLVLVDGWHRIAALERLQRDTVEAVVNTATEAQAAWMAAQANLGHGLPLKAGEIRTAFRAYIRAGRYKIIKSGKRALYKSYRDIAAELGGLKAHTTIRYWMMKFFPRIAKLYGGADLYDRKETEVATEDTFSGRAQDVLKAIQEAQEAFAGVADVCIRGRLIEQLEGVVREMKKGPYVVVTNDF